MVEFGFLTILRSIRLPPPMTPISDHSFDEKEQVTEVEKVREPGNLVHRKFFKVAERNLRFELIS